MSKLTDKPEYKIKGSSNARRKAYRAYLREMTSQGLMNDASGSWVGHGRARGLNGGNKCWKAVYCGTFPHAQLPVYDLHPKVGKGKG